MGQRFIERSPFGIQDEGGAVQIEDVRHAARRHVGHRAAEGVGTARRHSLDGGNRFCHHRVEHLVILERGFPDLDALPLQAVERNPDERIDPASGLSVDAKHDPGLGSQRFPARREIREQRVGRGNREPLAAIHLIDHVGEHAKHRRQLDFVGLETPGP